MKKKKCYIYTRVSTAIQTEGYSLEAQTERLYAYAEYKELEIVGEYCDAGKSGKNIKGRPEFLKMLDDITSQKDEVAFVLVFKLSRFGRNAADVLKSLQLLMDYGVDLICVEDAIDSSTQGGRLTLTILSAVAEIERENIQAQFLAGKMQKLSEGGWPGGPIPYGYRSINKKLILEPEEARVVKLIYDLYLQDDMTLYSVVNYLNGNGYRKDTKNGSRPFTEDTVKTILTNPVYHGKILYNRRNNDKSQNKKVKDIITVEGMHESIVTEKQWEAVQKKRDIHKNWSKKIDDLNRISLLSGLIKCPMCGVGMVIKKNKHVNHKRGGYYKILYHYSCRNYRKSSGRTCNFNHTYNQEKVDGAVFETICNLKYHPAFKKLLYEKIGNQEKVDTMEQELKKLRKSLHSEEMKRKKIGEDLDNLDIFAEEYDKKYEKIQTKIDAVYDRIEALEAEVGKKMKKLSAARQGIYSADKIIKLLENLKKLYGHMTCEEKRELFRLFIEKIEVYPEHPEGKIIKRIFFKFPVYYEDQEVSLEKAPDEQILFTLDCSGLELTAAEAKATYGQIKNYILEKYGVKVSSLYIAQIKRKYGLDVGVNYNVSKKTNARVPKCPKEKEICIMNALKHYKMLDKNTELIK